MPAVSSIPPESIEAGSEIDEAFLSILCPGIGLGTVDDSDETAVPIPTRSTGSDPLSLSIIVLLSDIAEL